MNFPEIILTSDDIERYDNQGYLVVRNLLSEGMCKQIQDWAHELVNLPEVAGRHWVYHETSALDGKTNLISRIENIQEFHQGFQTLNEVLATGVDQIFREKSVLFKEKMNFKMPGGDGFKPHQDSQAGWEAYASDFITAMISIDRATEENGCLKMGSGTFKKEVTREWEPLTEEDLDGIEITPCPTEPGDIVFFDSYTPHSSEPNMSDKIRRIYFATYNKASEGDHLKQYYADKHKNFPPDIEREAGKEYIFKV